MKIPGQRSLPRLGTKNSSNHAFSPKKVHIVGFVGWGKKQIIILSFFYYQKSNNKPKKTF